MPRAIVKVAQVPILGTGKIDYVSAAKLACGAAARHRLNEAAGPAAAGPARINDGLAYCGARLLGLGQRRVDQPLAADLVDLQRPRPDFTVA